MKMEICKTQFKSILYQTTTSKPFNYKTLLLNPSKTPQFALSSHSQYNKPCSLLLNSHSQPIKSIKQSENVTQPSYSLAERLKNGNLRPLQLLQDDGDWSNTQFWSVIKFLQDSSRFLDILQVFNAWTKLQESRINYLNYNKVIRLLIESGMTDEATSVLQNMKNSSLQLSSDVYNSIIHGYALEGKFDDALQYLNEMEEANVNPDTETYDGLIKGYGKFQMYDEMVKCLKRMENNGCSPDHVTYNLLIHELAKGRLLNRMERMYHTLVSKRLDLQSSTLIAMLEAYADFGVLDKMEMFYVKVRNSKKTTLNERMVRKIARVYVENHLFSKLDDLANDVGIRMGRTNLFWCLRVLSQGCQLSKKGMNGVIQLMEEERVPWTVTVVNIILFAYLKMKDFKHLDMVLNELPHRYVQPDLVTFGILYDGHIVGFEWSKTLKIWRKYGYLKNGVELNTNSLVFTAFGKGVFLKTVEEMSSLLEPKLREQKLWTYETLFEFVSKHHGSSPSLLNDTGSSLTSSKRKGSISLASSKNTSIRHRPTSDGHLGVVLR